MVFAVIENKDFRRRYAGKFNFCKILVTNAALLPISGAEG
jgi:hypothetical protein